MRSYSHQEKEKALRQLALDGNLSKTAEVCEISIPTLSRWRDEQRRESMNSESQEMDKFVKNAWRNIHSLNSPKFVKELKARALNGKKSNLREVFSAVAILVREVRFQSRTPKEAESDELEDNLTEEEIDRMIKEEEEKIRRERRAGQDEGEA